MSENATYSQFELTREFVLNLKEIIEDNNVKQEIELIADLHVADIAEIYDELSIEEAKFIHPLLDEVTASEIISELEDDVRDKFLKALPGEIIAENVIKNMESDDAADVIGDLPEEKKAEVLSNIEDIEQAGDIVELLNYDEDTAGGLMAKELLAVNKNLSVRACLVELRQQAEKVKNIYYIYVIDDDEKLVGTLSLKKLLLAQSSQIIFDICNTDIITVHTGEDDEDVANLMHKYGLIALPVVDGIGRLVGKITIDDVVDVIKEEAERDYQMVSGLTEDVESSDSVFQLIRARIPWLLIGLLGGILGAGIIGHFEGDLMKYAGLALFLPLIAAMGGNVGVQSSSIVVQSLAAGNADIESVGTKLFKELLVAIINGLVLATLIMSYTLLVNNSYPLTISVSISLFVVIIFASLFGTFVPLVLDKLKIDPALATGPFITTVNDIMGLLIYLSIARIIFNMF